MLICTEGTFGAKYHGQLAAQHSCQNVLECPLTVMELLCCGTWSLWHFNGNFVSLVMKRNHSACPRSYIDDVLCWSDLQTLADGLRLFAVDRDSAIERLRALIMCPELNPASIFMLGGGDPLETGWPPCGLNPIYWMLPLTKSQSLSSPSEKRSDLNKRFPEHQIPKPHFCFLSMTSFADLQHVTALKLVNASPFTGTVWCLVNDARICCWRIAQPSQSKCSLANH